MTAVLAVIAYAALGIVLVLVAAVAVLWPALGPQDIWMMAWLAAMAVTVAGSGVAWEWLGKRRRGGAQ